MTDNVTQLPEPGVILDLDIEEKPNAKDPFKVKVGGKVITFADPDDIPWQDLATVGIPADLIRVSMKKEDAKHIQDQTKLPTWKFRKLMDTYYSYYDMEEKIRDAKRQQQFNGI